MCTKMYQLQYNLNLILIVIIKFQKSNIKYLKRFIIFLNLNMLYVTIEVILLLYIFFFVLSNKIII